MRAGKLSTVEYLKVLQGFVDEDNYTVWSDLASNLEQLGKLMQYTGMLNTLK